jgi:hypothetical protein
MKGKTLFGDGPCLFFDQARDHPKTQPDLGTPVLGARRMHRRGERKRRCDSEGIRTIRIQDLVVDLLGEFSRISASNIPANSLSRYSASPPRRCQAALLEQTVLLLEVVDHVPLMTVYPPGEQHQ